MWIVCMYSLSVLAGLDRTSLCLAYQPLLPTLLAIDKIYGFVSTFMNGSLLHDQNVMENQTTLFWHGKFTWGDHQQHAGSYLEAVSPA